MKKNLKKILCGLLSSAIFASVSPVFAADTAVIQWYGDYSDNTDPKLVVDFTSPAQYIQQVTSVIYPASVATPAFDDYIRMSEITVDGTETTEFVYDIENEFTESNGAYKIAVQANGYMSDVAKAEVTVYVITPSKIPVLLSELNSATASNFGTPFAKVMPALQLEDESEPATKSKRLSAMVDIKQYDLNGSFANLEDVRKAWDISDILVYINDSSATSAGLAEKLIADAELLGVDIEDADFKKYVDENGTEDEGNDGVADNNDLCVKILSSVSGYNNGAGVKSCADILDIIGENLGVIVINAASDTLIDDAFDKYKSYFDIDEASLTKYEGFNLAEKGKVLRKLYNRNYAKASDLVADFKTAVERVAAGEENNTPPIIIVPNGTQTGGGNSSPGGMSAPTPTAAPESTFRDLPSSHWAYGYVKALAEKNVINGYDDGTFRPSNNVTREEFVKMIISATGMLQAGSECDFTDVPKSAWYYEYVASAYAKGIVSGIDDEAFGVGTNITRQDVAVIAARIIKRLKGTVPQTGDSALTDIDTVSDYATDSVKLLNGMGIINGYDDGSFMPKNTLTRAEAATIICKLIKSL